MDINGRYDHIEDVLVNMHSGQWFGWSNSSKVYANLIIHDDTKTKPTEKSLTDALAKQQSDFDANEYQRSRASEYPSITDVVVALAEKEEGDSAMWDDITAKRQAVKTKYKKG